VNVLSRPKLRTFYQSKPAYAKHAKAFESWYKIARKAEWNAFADAKASLGQTDVATNTRSGATVTIFDIGGNKYRIATLIDYARQTVLITHVMTHAECDQSKWKREI